MEDLDDSGKSLNGEESESGVPDDMVTVPDLSAKQSVSNSAIPEESNERSYDLNNIEDILSLIKTKDDKKIKNNIEKHIWEIVKSHRILDGYNCVFLFDDMNSITRVHAERIYSSLQKFDNKKDIVLFLRSRGGSAEPAYLISQLCNKFKKSKFIVSIPAEAKSAATLLSFGADEIHMGPMSELGPIDIQVDGLPLLSVSSALTKIASIVDEYPRSADMFARYLTENLSIGLIGYYDRVTESATQYAQILLSGKHDENTRTVDEIASHFTNHYKDHGFVIDIEESKNILGEYMVKDDTEVYRAGSSILSFINSIEFAFVLSGVKKKVVFVGGGCEMMVENSNKDEILLRDIRGMC